MSQSGSVNVGPAPTFWETDGSDSRDERAGVLEPGEMLGRYVVLYRLGTGGMGIVYAAYDPQLDRKVALKLLRRASSNKARRKRATERLMHEARAMARLTHPNVITVHDAAEFDGRIFVAMEFVDGVTLTRHLASGDHPWRKTLEVLVEAGRGLAAAHEAGLVHRDFKPDNVMLSRDGRVLVMDFGLARALEPDDEHDSMRGMSRPQTAASSDIDEGDGSGVLPIVAGKAGGNAPPSRVAGTPGYMAPEQHRAQPTDSRTDQFSFAVTLYEALYRQRPFKGDSPDRIADHIEAERVTEPPPNSGVPHWVHAIVLRGMRARPADRWDSMAQMMAALEDDPAAHRRRWLLWAGIGLAGTAAVGSTAYLLGDNASICDGADARIAEVWAEPQRNRVGAAFAEVDRPYAKDALAGTLETLDDYAEQWGAMHREACEANHVRGEQSDDLFDLRMDCLSRRHSELHALSELFSEADVDVVKEAVVAASKLTPLAACADVVLLRATVPMPDDPEVRATVGRIREELARAKAYEDGARNDRALELSNGVLDQARTVGYSPVLAETLVRRGTTLMAKGELRDAEEALRESLREAAIGRHDEVAARAWIALTTVLSQSGQIERSVEAVAVATTAVLRAGNTDKLAASLANAQGTVHFSRGDYPRAQLAFERALAKQQRAFGDNHPSVARFYNNLALAHGQQGDLAESMRFLRRAVALEEQVLGSVHPRVAMFVANLGAMELQRGNLEEAEKQIKRALDIFERAVGDAPRLGLMLNNLGELRMQAGDPVSAKGLLQRAIRHQERTLGDHPDLAMSLTNLAMAHVLNDDVDDALVFVDRAAAMLRDSGATEHPTYAHVLAVRGATELELGRPEAAVDHFGQAIERLTKVPGMTSNPELGWMRFGLAQALLAAEHDPVRAGELATAAYKAIAKLPPVPLNTTRLGQIKRWQAKHFPTRPSLSPSPG